MPRAPFPVLSGLECASRIADQKEHSNIQTATNSFWFWLVTQIAFRTFQPPVILEQLPGEVGPQADSLHGVKGKHGAEPVQHLWLVAVPVLAAVTVLPQPLVVSK